MPNKYKPKSKSLNISYNFSYNNSLISWKEKLMNGLDRKKAEITFNLHLFNRAEYWKLDLDKIEETVRTGNVFDEKCEKPNKVCFKKYFGKENITYTVIVRYHKNFIEVKTAWPRKGR